MKSLQATRFLAAGALAAGSRHCSPRESRSRERTRTRSRASCSSSCAARWMGSPRYRRTAIRTMRAAARSGVARSGHAGGVLPLSDPFGLHPSWRFCTSRLTARELVVFHAVASPYRERSHFDGQDVLENGTVRPHAVQTGWLNRALAAHACRPLPNGEGCCAGPERAARHARPAAVTSWSPSKLAALDDDTLQRITDLYASDPLLAKRLADALAADEIAASTAGWATRRR